jgi:hypothetical protein
MIDNTKHIINRLKLQPRHGAKKKVGDDTNWTTRATDLVNSLQDMSDIGAFDDIGKLATAFEDLTTGQAAAATGLQKLIGIQQQFGEIATKLTDQITKLEQRNKKLNKTFGMSIEQSAEFGQNMDLLAAKFKIGGTNARRYATELNKLTAGYIASSKISKTYQENLIQGRRYMVDMLGVTDEAADGFEMLAMQQGKSAFELQSDGGFQGVIGKIEELTGLTGVSKQITEDLGSAAATVQLQYGRMPATLGLAAMKAKAMGVTMDELAGAGKKLLNIESSVGAELEYQLLSGRRLVDAQGRSYTNMYREATLRGDMNAQADIMHKALMQEGDQLETNVLAREKFADSMGIEEETLARMLQKRKLLKQMGAENLFELTGKKLEDELKKMGKPAADIAKIMEADDTRDTQTRMADRLDQLYTEGFILRDSTGKISAAFNQKDIIKGASTQLLDTENGILKNLNDGLATFRVMMTDDVIYETVGAVENLKLGVDSTITAIKTLTDAVPFFADKISELEVKLASAFSTVLGGGLPDMADMDPAISTATTPTATMRDGIIMNDGLIRFNPRDKFMQVNDSTMIAGTNVDGNRRLARQLSGGGGISDNQISRLAAAIASTLKETLPTVKMSVMSDPLYAANKLNRGRYS